MYALSNNFGHEQYPSNSMNQNNSTHGVYKYPHEGIVFRQGLNFAFLGVKKGYFVLSARLE
jgi:hypothetical protein